MALSKNISPVSMEYVAFSDAKVGQAKKQKRQKVNSFPFSGNTRVGFRNLSRLQGIRLFTNLKKGRRTEIVAVSKENDTLDPKCC